jgi:hypothetical protein
VYLGIIFPVIDAIPELRGHKKGLKKTVHITGGANIGKSFIVFV